MGDKEYWLCTINHSKLFKSMMDDGTPQEQAQKPRSWTSLELQELLRIFMSELPASLVSHHISCAASRIKNCIFLKNVQVDIFSVLSMRHQQGEHADLAMWSPGIAMIINDSSLLPSIHPYHTHYYLFSCFSCDLQIVFHTFFIWDVFI